MFTDLFRLFICSFGYKEIYIYNIQTSAPGMACPKLIRIPLLLITVLMGVCLFLTRNSWSVSNPRRSGHHGYGDVQSFLAVRGNDDGGINYIRDKSGYIYPKGYFDFERPGIPPSVKEMNILGRHSDDVMPVCKNFTNGAGKHIDPVFDYRIPSLNFSKQHKNPCWYAQTKDGGKRLSCIPYFYFIGTPKAGSTDLYFRITKHPDVTACGAKERRFFDRQRFVKPSWNRFNYYLYSYNKASVNIAKKDDKGRLNTMIFGDGSPTYMYNNVNWFKMPGNEGCLEPRITCISYIHYMNPGAKLILIMRSPVDRLYSSYLYNWVRTGALRTPEEFHDWASKSVNAHVECFKKHPFRACLYSAEIIGNTVLTLSASIYSRLIMDVLKLFPRDQLHVIKMEDYSANTTTYMAELFDYLGLAHLNQSALMDVADAKQHNQGRSYNFAGPMWPKTRKMLYDFYRPFNQELVHILQDEKYLWHEDL